MFPFSFFSVLFCSFLFSSPHPSFVNFLRIVRCCLRKGSALNSENRALNFRVERTLEVTRAHKCFPRVITEAAHCGLGLMFALTMHKSQGWHFMHRNLYGVTLGSCDHKWLTFSIPGVLYSWATELCFSTEKESFR